jgi:RHH-type proline utilization regulon transcriptional repressor/proline dehydrogenase/delta 1-pyrroline-5-carboxylate dehydrogenase
MVNISVKPTAFYSQVRPADFEGSVQGICGRLRPVLALAREVGAHINLDMEQYRVKDITLEVFRRLRSDTAFRDYPHLGLVLQAYLTDTEEDLEDLLAWAEKESLPLSVRLVKGAYWDYETVIARQNGWRVPVFTGKAATDAAFERLAARILENHQRCYLACASHNVRTVAAVMERARALGVGIDGFEFQVLYGMAEPVRRALLKEAGRVRLYAPFGELLPGISYLVRRLLENTSNESFVRRRFVEEEEEEQLLVNPAAVPEAEEKNGREPVLPSGQDGPAPFVNQPLADFTRADLREGFTAALAAVREDLGRSYPIVVDGREIETGDRLASLNPADPSEIIGEICQAGTSEIDNAVESAEKALAPWRDTPAEERAGVLFRAAEIARREILLLSAWEVLEVGKQWDQAHGDVAEAIDYFEYYARETLRLGRPRSLGETPGEVNRYSYQPKGVAAVIAPWNFPLAISAGMTAAALASGNCVLYKPSGLSPVTGAILARIYREAGVPPGVFNFVPGRGSVVGDHLVEHPGVGLIAFTGSMEVGLGIVRKAAPVRGRQRQVKKVIAEMGGKNAVIIDDDADLDEAVTEVLASAFGYQGQKCSACSRVVVLEAVHQAFSARLIEAARSLRVGPAEDPANYLGAMIDGAARDKVRSYIEVGRGEGTPLLLRDESPGPGYYAPLAVFDGITPSHRLAREEIFGPVLSLMRAADFGEALETANATPYALTGAVFSRSPRNLKRAVRDFRVGNLYLNRGCTGALVSRQPFGGFGMSGIGSKAGGPDYLLQFVDPRTVTENTMRRGFAPSPKE